MERMSAGVQQARLGDFELLAKVGEGGMGAVYKARQISLDRIVALKVLPRRLAQDQVYIGRFLREARAMARLNHKNIVAGFDVTFSDGYYYCVMEFVDGFTVREWIKKQRRVPETDVLRIGSTMASALSHAHEVGIIHRDVKPENIIISTDGVPKLTDLGLSKSAELQDAHLTQSGAVVGTAYYIAPEQARGEPADGRADTYALGCTLYHAATGKTPFEAPTPAVLMLKHISEKMIHPQSHQADLSDGFCTVLARMVARDPAQRYAHIGDAGRDMAALLEGLPLAFPPLPPDAVNFLPGPKSAVAPRPSQITSAVRNSVRKSAAATAPAVASAVSSGTSRAARQSFSRTGANPSWIPFAGIATVVLLALAVLLFNMQGSAPAEKPADKFDTLPSTPLSTTLEKRTPVSTPPPPVAPQVVASPGPFSPLVSTANSLDEWHSRPPEAWSVRNGALDGVGLEDGSSQVMRGGALPANFEMTFTLAAKGAFHLGWSTGQPNVNNYLERQRDGVSRLTRYNGVDEASTLGTGAFAVPDGKHTFCFAVYDAKIKVYVDGRLLASSSEGGITRPPDRHDLYLYAHAGAIVEFQNLGYRALNSAADFEACPIKN